MCIIVSKEKGVAMPSKDILRNCFNRNSDGAGLMYVNKGKVVIRKGFMNFSEFYEYIEKLNHMHDLTEKAMVMHFRISTGGKVDGGNCHPYPITSDAKRLRQTSITTTLGMAHNGVISDYNRKDTVLNDTQCFVRDCVSTIYNYDKNFFNNIRTMSMLKDIAGSKLCFLDSNENIHYVGDFVEDKGVLYSNTTYKTFLSYPLTHGGWDCDDYTYGYGYGYDSYGYTRDTFEYDSYEDKGCSESELEEYDTIIASKIEQYKKADYKPLSQEEFGICLEFSEILEKGTVITYSEGKFVVPVEGKYALDNFYNVYYVDYDAHDMYLIYEDVLIDVNKVVTEASPL